MRMITGLSHAMRKLATWWVLAVTAGVFVVFAVAFFATSLPFSIAHVTSLCGAPPPDVRFYTPADGVTQFLTGCGEAGRAAYRDLQVADLFYPAVSGLFLASALAVVLVRHLPSGQPGHRPGCTAIAGQCLRLPREHCRVVRPDGVPGSGRDRDQSARRGIDRQAGGQLGVLAAAASRGRLPPHPGASASAPGQQGSAAVRDRPGSSPSPAVGDALLGDHRQPGPGLTTLVDHETTGGTTVTTHGDQQQRSTASSPAARSFR